MITVAISSYNYGHLAAHCIESILSQSKLPNKILFVDDGAGDCSHLPKIYPEVEFIFREKNLGVIENFNNLLTRVNTERYLIIGADNWLRSDAIERISKQNTDIITYDIIVTGTGVKEFGKKRVSNEHLKRGMLQPVNFGAPINPELYWSRNNLHHGSIVYKTELAKRFGFAKKNINGKYSEEDHYLFDKVKESGASISHISEGLLFYRTHKENFNKY
jgi:glycosyltransferase involved in cell wall biosynthesis